MTLTNGFPWRNTAKLYPEKKYTISQKKSMIKWMEMIILITWSGWGSFKKIIDLN